MFENFLCIKEKKSKDKLRIRAVWSAHYFRRKDCMIFLIFKPLASLYGCKASACLTWSKSPSVGFLTSILIMPPTLKKLMGHIAFGACVGAWVGGCVTLFVPTVTFKPLKLES